MKKILILTISALLAVISSARTPITGKWVSDPIIERVNGVNSATTITLDFNGDGTFNSLQTIDIRNMPVDLPNGNKGLTISISSHTSYAGTYRISEGALVLTVDRKSMAAAVDHLSLNTDIPEMENKIESTEKFLKEMMDSKLEKELRKEIKKSKELSYKDFTVSGDELSYSEDKTGKKIVYHRQQPEN